jgi:hypothetical protein
MTTRKIFTHFEYPPIPDRSHDWSAVYEGYDGGDPMGWGPTEEAAIEDLKQWYEDEE